MNYTIHRPAVVGLAAITACIVHAGDARAFSADCAAKHAMSGYDVVLLAGQSNMVGFGLPYNAAVDGATYAGIDQLDRTGLSIVPARDALQHADVEGTNRTGLGMSFARAYLQSLPLNRKVLLVPSAYGATAFSNNHWNNGDDMYEAAVLRMNIALSLNSGNCVAALLWHQGETDARVVPTVPKEVHAANLDRLIMGLRTQITGAAKAPFILGQLSPDWIATQPLPGQVTVGAAIDETPQRVPLTAVVSSVGLKGNGGEENHFDTPSQRIFGQRYFDALAAALANTVVAPTTPVNPGFESPGLSSGTTVEAPRDAGWTFVGPALVSSAGSTDTTGTPAAPQGLQVGVLRNGGSVAQWLDLHASDALTLRATQRVSGTSGDQRLAVYVNGIQRGPSFLPARGSWSTHTVPLGISAANAGPALVEVRGMTRVSTEVRAALVDAVGVTTVAAGEPARDSVGNPGFDDISVAGGVANGAVAGHWRFIGMATLASNNTPLTSGAPAAPSGTQQAVLRNTAYVSQALALGSGDSVRFKATQRVSGGTGDQRVGVFVDGVLQDQAITPPSGSWGTYNVPLTLPSLAWRSLEIRGMAASSGQDRSALVDDVTLIAGSGGGGGGGGTSHVTGSILREYWTGIPGNTVAALTSSPAYPASPTGSGLLGQFRAPTNFADNYGQRIRGYVIPAVTGSYTFWIAGDDESQLRLSTNESPANARLIANVPGYTGATQWGKYPQQTSAAITLQAGQAYYIEALHKEAAGGDNLAVAWKPPGGSRAVIPGKFLAPFSP